MRSARSTSSTRPLLQSLLVAPRARRACSCCRRRSSRRSPTRSAPPRWCASSSCCADFCAFVVVDTPAYFNDVVLGLIEASDDVLLVAGMDIPNIKNVKIGLQTLRLLNTPMAKLQLVLNRANSQGEARRRRGRAHAADQGRRPDPERRRRAAVGEQGRRRSCSTPRSPASPSRSSSLLTCSSRPTRSGSASRFSPGPPGR